MRPGRPRHFASAGFDCLNSGRFGLTIRLVGSFLGIAAGFGRFFAVNLEHVHGIIITNFVN